MILYFKHTLQETLVLDGHDGVLADGPDELEKIEEIAHLFLIEWHPNLFELG